MTFTVCRKFFQTIVWKGLMFTYYSFNRKKFISNIFLFFSDSNHSRSQHLWFTNPGSKVVSVFLIIQGVCGDSAEVSNTAQDKNRVANFRMEWTNSWLVTADNERIWLGFIITGSTTFRSKRWSKSWGKIYLFLNM